MKEAAFFAKQYLEDLLSFFGLKIDVTVTFDDEAISLDVPSTSMNGFLIGSRSKTMDAFHSLVVCAVKQQTGQYCRINLDIANYKKRHIESLSRKTQDWIKEVQESGQNKKLEPMNAADRRLIHQWASQKGLTTESIGEGDQRRVILKKTS